jgi:lipopolysaccharide export system ATP-binding protein
VKTAAKTQADTAEAQAKQGVLAATAETPAPRPASQSVNAELPKVETPAVAPAAPAPEPRPSAAAGLPAGQDLPPRAPIRVEPQVVGLPPRAPQANGSASGGPRLVTPSSGLTARHLGKQFKRRPVLRDVTVSVQRGEAVGLLGPNGAGKTTCFYIITGLINADTGTIEMDGVDITHLPMYRRSRMGIGYLPQEASIFRGLTVEENIRAVLEVVEPERDMREATLDDLLAEFSISHLRRTPALALSGGERRRVEIARALASRPQFMLLDEPLAGIDPIAVGEIRELIWHLRKRGIGVLITDHNVRETLDIVDRAYILHDGSVLMDGRPSEIVAHQDVRRVYLGERFSL